MVNPYIYWEFSVRKKNGETHFLAYVAAAPLDTHEARMAVEEELISNIQQQNPDCEIKVFMTRRITEEKARNIVAKQNPSLLEAF
jgi:hypothetical protein